MLNIGNRLECFFDQELLDMNATDAEVRLHQPVRREVSMVHDAEWEGDMSNYHCILNDDGLYRMYYLGWRYRGNAPVVCYAESRDGVHWVKPVIGTHEFAGSRENNIVLDKTENPEIDNFMVFKDENPLCDPEKRYKAAASSGETIDGVHHHRVLSTRCTSSSGTKYHRNTGAISEAFIRLPKGLRRLRPGTISATSGIWNLMISRTGASR